MQLKTIYSKRIISHTIMCLFRKLKLLSVIYWWCIYRTWIKSGIEIVLTHNSLMFSFILIKLLCRIFSIVLRSYKKKRLSKKRRENKVACFEVLIGWDFSRFLLSIILHKYMRQELRFVNDLIYPKSSF